MSAIEIHFGNSASSRSFEQIACRLASPQAVQQETKAKISMFCHVGKDQVIGVHDMSSVYHVPLLLESQGIIPLLQRKLNLLDLSIPVAMAEKGADLHKRWKGITTGLVSVRV